jgi:hypothetical protein
MVSVIPHALRVEARISIAGLARVVVLLLAGAAPVSAIALHVMGWISMQESAGFVVAPLVVAAIVLVRGMSYEARWAARGAGAGLAAVLAYDAVRLPLVRLNVWPDFIPRIGGWLTGAYGHDDALLGYAWRYLGDGAGIGLAYFALCAVVLQIKPDFVQARPIALSIGYAVFVWTGLLATVIFPQRGETLLFGLTPASFALSLLGHLIYGSVLGLYLRRYLAQDEFAAPT